MPVYDHMSESCKGAYSADPTFRPCDQQLTQQLPIGGAYVAEDTGGQTVPERPSAIALAYRSQLGDDKA